MADEYEKKHYTDGENRDPRKPQRRELEKPITNTRKKPESK